MADRRLIASSRVDRMYCLRHGTAALAARAGLVKAAIRPGRGRSGETVLIDPHDAALRWGPKILTAANHVMEPAHA